MDGSDAAMYTLAQRLLAIWHWTVETSRPLICLPALTILNIKQFLNKDVEGCGWDIQDWLEAYANALLWVAEAAKGRCWMPMGRDFTPQVSLLVKAFASMLNVDIPLASSVSCWDSPPACIQHQRDEDPLAHIISYLDEKATSQPTHKAWDELVWLPPSSTPPCLREMNHLASYKAGQWKWGLQCCLCSSV